MDAQLLRVLCVLGKTLMCRNDKSYRPKPRGTNANAVCSAHKEKPEGKKVLKRDLNHWTHCATQFYTQPHWLIFGSPFLRQDNNSSAFSGWNRQLSKKHSHTKKKRRTQDKKKERHRRHVFLCLTRGEMSLSATYVCWTLRFPTFSLTSIVTYCTHRSHTEQKHTLIRVIYVSLSVSRLKPREPNTQNTINVKPQNDLYINHIGLFIFIILLLARKEERKNEKRNRLLYVQLKCMC